VIGVWAGLGDWGVVVVGRFIIGVVGIVFIMG
jgi:hypothetical protein